MGIKTMLTASAMLLATTATPMHALSNADDSFIGKQQPTITNHLMTPEVLWAMGRVGGFQLSPDGRQAVYGVTYYSVKQNKSHTVLCNKKGASAHHKC